MAVCVQCMCVGFDFNVSPFIYFHVCIIIMMMIHFGCMVADGIPILILNVHQKRAFSQIVLDENK